MKILISYIALLLFLFPMAEKGMHAFSFEHDEHCAEHELTHLHEKHHDCKLCDYQIDTTTDHAANSFKTIIPSFFYYSVAKLEIYSGTTFDFFSLRAPPVLS